MVAIERQQGVLQALEGKGVITQCPACGHRDLYPAAELLVRISALKRTDEGGYEVAGEFPCVPVLCKRCGFLMFFDTVILKGA